MDEGEETGMVPSVNRLKSHFSKPLLLPLGLAAGAVVVAIHMACASSSGATYARGSPARPPPAQTRPGVGLPVYDPQSKPLPPQPNPKPKRVLPPSMEPGIWAGDEPHAPDSPSAGIYDKPWPVYPPSPKERVSIDITFEAPPDLLALLPKQTIDVRLRCQWNMIQASLKVPRFWELTSFPSRMQQCAHAKMVRHCYESNLDEYLTILKKALAIADPLLERVLGDLLAKARMEHRRLCTGTKLDNDVKAIVDDVLHEFDAMMEAGNGIDLNEIPRSPLPGGPKH